MGQTNPFGLKFIISGFKLGLIEISVFKTGIKNIAIKSVRKIETIIKRFKYLEIKNHLYKNCL